MNVSAPEQNVEKPIGKLKVLRQNGAPAEAKRTFSNDAVAKCIWEGWASFLRHLWRDTHISDKERAADGAPPPHHRRTTAAQPPHHRRTTGSLQAAETAPEGVY
jgi:hypothetical protein